MENIGILLDGKYGELKLMMKDNSSYDEAMMWEEKTHKGTTPTLELEHYNYNQVEAIYNKSNMNFIMYNINLDKLEKDTEMSIIINEKKIDIDMDNIYKYFKELSKNNEDVKFENEYLKAFDVPTILVKLNDSVSMKVKLWLQLFGHRLNQMHVQFEKAA